MTVIVYTKTGCPWTPPVTAFLKENHIPFEERDIFKNPEYRKEVEEKSGQNKSPTLDIDGVIVPDAGVEEVAAALAQLAGRINS
ncbi:MAG: glutaredoxin [Parcubacteria group bacterium Gr01-1014_49]|nr:MAG: glutaredoxin [Parcubacteria group bacterium Gr01-1014_49]